MDLFYLHTQSKGNFTSPPAILIYLPQVRSLCTSFRRSGAVHTSNERTGAALPPASVYFTARQAKGFWIQMLSRVFKPKKKSYSLTWSRVWAADSLIRGVHMVSKFAYSSFHGVHELIWKFWWSVILLPATCQNTKKRKIIKNHQSWVGKVDCYFRQRDDASQMRITVAGFCVLYHMIGLFPLLSLFFYRVM